MARGQGLGKRTYNHNAKVEDELIALVLGVSNGHRQAQHRVLALGLIDRDEAIEEGLARDDVLLHYIKVEQAGLPLRTGALWHDAPGGRLSNDLGS